MQEKYRCVIDAEGRYVAFVLVLVEDGAETVREYTLGDGETLIPAKPPALKSWAGMPGMVAPVWDAATEAWKESAGAEEIAAWEELHPAPTDGGLDMPPTETDRLRADVDYLLMLQEG